MAKKVTFESKMSEIEILLEKMQQPETGLENAVELYEQAVELISQCRATLDGAQFKIEEISLRKGVLEAEDE